MLALFADTGTIRAHGAACAAHTADLAALAAVLRTLPSHLPSLGPAADRFAASSSTPWMLKRKLLPRWAIRSFRPV